MQNKQESKTNNKKHLSVNGFYFPSLDDPFFQKEFENKIIYNDGNEDILKYRQIPGPFYWDVDDFLSNKIQANILSKRNEKQSVIIGVPTYKSEKYIYDTLIGDRKQRDILTQVLSIKDKYPNWAVELVICVTPYSKNDNTIDIIKRVQKEAMHKYPSIKITIIIMPLRGKVNAMNILSEYSKKRNVTILCFLDDDTLHCPSMALLSNIETLLSQEKISIVTSRYLPPEPKHLWEKMRTIRFRLNINKTVTGRIMIIYAQSYPKIPSYLNSDDLFLTAYFFDVKNKNPFNKIYIKDDSLAISKIAGDNFIFGLKVLRRSSLGIIQLLSLMPKEKKKLLMGLIRGNSFFHEINKLKKQRDNLDILLYIFYNIIKILILFYVKAELSIRQILRIPKKSIIYFRDESTFPISES